MPLRTARVDRNLVTIDSLSVRFILTWMLVVSLPFASIAHDPDAPEAAAGQDGGEHSNLSEIGAKLSNPVSDLWALFTQFGITWSDGDINTGDAEIGGNMIFQPILPVPLYGEGDNRWQILVRPAIPILFANSVPEGFNRFDNETGIGDISLPLPITPPTGNWILGLGPTFLIPSSSQDAFGQQQWGIGPTGILGYKTKDWILGTFPQYYFGIGSRGDQGSKPDASNLSWLYFGFYNLPDAWQIGFGPTITFDDKASKGNKWNVPIGLLVTKTTKVGARPVKFQFGFEYSVVSQDDFGTRFQIKFNVIPVVQSLFKKPIFGGS